MCLFPRLDSRDNSFAQQQLSRAQLLWFLCLNLVDKYHLITRGQAPSILQLFSCLEMCFLSRDGFSQSLNLHLQPVGEEQDYSSLCNRGGSILDAKR